MTKYTIHYERKVQVRPYEMLTIGLTQEFDTTDITKALAFDVLRARVDAWIYEETRRLGAP